MHVLCKRHKGLCETWCLATVIVQVDGGRSCAVEPARDQLQGDASLLQLLSSAAQAHI